jgi:flagellar hook-basal body protein
VKATDGAVSSRISSNENGLGSTIKINPGTTGTDLAAGLGLPLNLVTGSETPATGATDLNALTTNLASYADGDLVEISGTTADGTPVLSTFQYGASGDGTTVQEFVDFISTQYPTATAAFNGTTGQITLTADTPGDSSLSMVIQDGTGQAGKMDWAQNAMAVTTNGAGPDTVTTSMEVWDESGVSRLLSFTYERQADGTWNLSTDMDPSEGTVVNGDVNGITFGTNGALATPTAADIQVQFAGQGTQTLTLEMGTPGGFDGLTQFGNPNSVKIASQDGFGAGELASMQVVGDGTIEGYYTNGEAQDLGNIGVTTFTNERGLEDVGQNFWRATANSGDEVLTTGLFGIAGEVIGGALEQSNVDTTEEFVLLIQAQRGFQASARIISTQDQILQEAINIV